MSSRTAKAGKNFASSTMYNITSSILSFISRTVFIYFLGNSYLGVNGLFTNVLGMLSLAELGIGSAITFSLYKPLAQKDDKKIQALINFYKKAYRIVALVVTVIGVSIIPFLRFIINGVDDVNNIVLIYCIFLFNTVSSYFITYKTTLLNADQKEYYINNVNTISKLIITIFQILAIIICRNYIVYLVVEAIFQLISKVFLNRRVNKLYPNIMKKNSEQLSKEDKKTIVTKIKALLFHKVGEVSIYQTDNIITSIFVSTGVVGLVSNFTLIINLVNKFIASFFNSAIAGLGNIIAVESKERQVEISEAYDFLGFCFFGWSTICLYFLLTPFVTLWIGKGNLIDSVTIALLCINFYLTGVRVALSNVKSAAGLYEQDKWVPIIQAIVNIVVSIICAKYMGLVGIYIGTFVSNIIPNIVRPIIVYKHVFKKSSESYFKQYFIRILLILGLILICSYIYSVFNLKNLIIELIIKALISSITFVITIYLLYRNSGEMKYLINMFKKKLLKR